MATGKRHRLKITFVVSYIEGPCDALKDARRLVEWADDEGLIDKAKGVVIQVEHEDSDEILMIEYPVRT